MRYPINCNDSATVWTLRVNPITGTARVRWFATPLTEYRHTHVSRRAILSLLWYSGNVSKGTWVNRYCMGQTSIGRQWRPIMEADAIQQLAQAAA